MALLVGLAVIFSIFGEGYRVPDLGREPRGGRVASVGRARRICQKMAAVNSKYRTQAIIVSVAIVVEEANRDGYNLKQSGVHNKGSQHNWPWSLVFYEIV